MEPWSYEFLFCMEMDRILIPFFLFLVAAAPVFLVVYFSIFLFDNGRAFPHIWLVCMFDACSYFVWRYQSEGCLWMPEAV